MHSRRVTLITPSGEWRLTSTTTDKQFAPVSCPMLFDASIKSCLLTRDVAARSRVAHHNQISERRGRLGGFAQTLSRGPSVCKQACTQVSVLNMTRSRHKARMKGSFGYLNDRPYLILRFVKCVLQK